MDDQGITSGRIFFEFYLDFFPHLATQSPNQPTTRTQPSTIETILNNLKTYLLLKNFSQFIIPVQSVKFEKEKRKKRSKKSGKKLLATQSNKR